MTCKLQNKKNVAISDGIYAQKDMNKTTAYLYWHRHFF
jgi:hypothetical protein